MKILLLLLLLIGFLLLFHELKVLGYMAETMRRTREGLDAASRQRSLADRKNLLELQEKHSFWYSLEQKLHYSGIRQRFPRMTPEWWLTWNAVVGAVLFLLFTVLVNVKTAVVVVAVCGLSEEFVLKKQRERNLRKTEENLTKLMDFLGNYSTTSGEIMSIFRQISRYMDEPVRSVLDSCCNEAATTGDVEMALRSLAEKLEHPKFKELIRNIEVSIRYCADFSALTESSRRSLREYLKVSGEKKGMLREAFTNLIILTGMSCVVLLTVERLTGVGVRQLLVETLPGKLALVVLGIIFVWFRGSMGNPE